MLQGLLCTLRDWALSGFLFVFISQVDNGRLPPWVEEDVHKSRGTQGMRSPQAPPSITSKLQISAAGREVTLSYKPSGCDSSQS